VSKLFSRFSHWTSDAVGHPAAFCVAAALVAAWAISGPFLHFSEVWQLTINTATTIITFLMVFVIQASQNRDTRAMQTKLDELVKAVEGAHNEVAGLENREE
jgi:low affinity Fe/Cu permease